VLGERTSLVLRSKKEGKPGLMAFQFKCPTCGTVHRIRQPYPPAGSEFRCTCGRKLAIRYPSSVSSESDDPQATEETAQVPSAGGPSRTPAMPVALLEEEVLEPTTLADTRPAPVAPSHRFVHAPVQPGPAKAPADHVAHQQKRSLRFRLASVAIALAAIAGLSGMVAMVVVFSYYGRDLPSLEALSKYRPPTVTEVYDSQGRLLGEIYEKRRYVVPLEKIPKPVQDAFIASEDANFRSHGGVDPAGIMRAMVRNLTSGHLSQGASTITQQVARNFLLSSEKKWSRKIKEVILARRIERAFDKDRILYLYLNQIYLGSGAYGVEAASRTYFDKHVQDLTLAEAAILAGLPQRPSDYSPIQDWQKARVREEYVLDQMVEKGFIRKAEAQDALAAAVDIVPKKNEFLTMAPYFTEYIRRYLVETYGFDKVYNDGLVVDSTCNLDLQKVAQNAVVDGVTEADEKVGWRGPLEHVADRDVKARLDATEMQLREAEAHSHLHVADPKSGKGGYDPLPATSTLKEGEIYQAVVLEVTENQAVVGVGAHKALIPLAWTAWAYKPNPNASWKGRRITSLTSALSRGDVVNVKIENLDFRDAQPLKGATAPGPGAYAAARLHQDPALEGAFLSFNLKDGAVQSMVGGVDFEKTEFNRATQAQRQVGSTFKPIVYAAAISTRKVTVGTLVQDAPVVFNALEETLWKPGNYGAEFLGNITLRKALQLSRNVCTVRVLDHVGLDVVYRLAGPHLRIGYPKPTCHRLHISAEQECQGESTPSPVQGMQWCSWCDASSCPVVKVNENMKCLDDPIQDSEGSWCHSCDVNLRVCDWLPISEIPSNERCADERRGEDGTILCRSCDLSMGLGSSSLTMVELARAYSAFATYGHLIEPHWINRVVDRDGTVIESYTPPGEWPRVLDAGVAGIAHWLLREVATGGTAAKSNQLGLAVAGKTGTTNDFHDAWFVGYNADILAATWVGYDQPKNMGQTFTGGEIALPIWMDYFRVAVPKSADHPFPPISGVQFVPIDESTGRVSKGGREMPLLPGTAPSGVVGEVGQKTTQDLLNTDF
jgi:penicillin-binding protein 1A